MPYPPLNADASSWEGWPPLEQLARGELDSQDLAILALTRDTMDLVDPMPAELIDRVAFQVSLELMNAELAHIQGEPAGIRAGVDIAESVTFNCGATTLMVMVSRDGRQVHLDAWVSGSGIEVELMQDDQRATTVSDLNGRLTFSDVHPGRTQFLIHPTIPGDRPIITPPMEL